MATRGQQKPGFPGAGEALPLHAEGAEDGSSKDTRSGLTECISVCLLSARTHSAAERTEQGSATENGGTRTRGREMTESEASLVYRISSRTARAT